MSRTRGSGRNKSSNRTGGRSTGGSRKSNRRVGEKPKDNHNTYRVSGHYHSHSHRGYGPRHHHDDYRYRHQTHTELSGLPAIFLIILVIGIFYTGYHFINTGSLPKIDYFTVQHSTINREPIDPVLVNETEYYHEDINHSSDVWIRKPNTLENGLRHFYDKTNIQPVVYITDHVRSNTNPSLDELDEYAEQVYDKLFTDEAHVLLLHFENQDSYAHGYSYHIVTGSETKTVMDDEAQVILLDYLDNNYSKNLTEDEFFSQSFKKTADRMMKKTRNPLIYVVIVIGGLVILQTLYKWWRKLLTTEEESEVESMNLEDN